MTKRVEGLLIKHEGIAAAITVLGLAGLALSLLK
jgi:hypothetical protein